MRGELLLAALEILVELGDELVHVHTVHLGSLLKAFRRGVRAEQAVHAETHKDRDDLPLSSHIHIHYLSDCHIRGDHGKNLLSMLFAI